MYFVLPIISIFAKIVLWVDTKFIVLDIIVLIILLLVFLLSSWIVYKRKNKIKQINEQMIPYIATIMVASAIAIRIMPSGSVDELIYGVFENKFDYKVQLLYCIFLSIIVIQLIFVFIYFQNKKKPIRQIFLPKSYKSIVIVTVFDISIVAVALLVKIILGINDAKILDTIYLASLGIIYIYCVGMVLFFNKFHHPKNMFASVSIAIPIVTSLVWMIIVLLPFDFWTMKFQYILLGAINLATIIIFYKTSRNKTNNNPFYGANK